MSGALNGWKETTLGECADWFSGGTPRTSVQEYWNGDIPWITASSLHDFYVRDSVRKVTQLGLENGTRLMPRDAVIFVVRGMSLKSEFRVGIARRPMAFGQDCKAIIAHDDVDPLYLANLLRAKQPEILSLVSEASHGTGRLETDALKRLQLLLPSLPTQRRIAAILGRLDDKIELNRRINRTLEAMAQALYKHWFVDFGPFQDGAFVESELGLIPAGWAVGPLASVIQLLSGGTPKTKVSEYWNGNIPWVAAKDVAAGAPFIMSTNRTITELGVAKSSTKILPALTTIITARGTVGECGLMPDEMAMNQTNYGVRGVDALGDFTTYLLIVDAVENLQKRAYGTIFDTITKKTFDGVPIPVPPNDIWIEFESRISDWFNQMLVNQRQIQKLAATRDYLLPKLLSGKVAVSP